jgi:hypothetical protein
MQTRLWLHQQGHVFGHVFGHVDDIQGQFAKYNQFYLSSPYLLEWLGADTVL